LPRRSSWFGHKLTHSHRAPASPVQHAPDRPPIMVCGNSFPLVRGVQSNPLRSRERRFESCRGAIIVSQDIVDVCLRTSWTGWQPLRLVVAGWVEGELAKQRPVAGEDADAEAGDQDGDFGSGVPSSDADVVELAAVAQGD